MTESIDFENSLKKLESIVEKLEHGDISLDESINLFEEGMKLSKQCSDCLARAKQQIITLSEAESEEEKND